MEKIFEKLFLLLIEYKNDKFIIKRKNPFLHKFTVFSCYLFVSQGILLFIFDKKIYYHQAIHIDFGIEPIKRIISLAFCYSFIVFITAQNFYQKFEKYSHEFIIYKFLFLTTSRNIEKEFKIEKNLAKLLIKNNVILTKILNFLCTSYDFALIFFIGEIAYSKLKNTNFDYVFLFKIILYVNLYFFFASVFRTYFFAYINKMLVSNYLRLKIANENKKVVCILKNYVDFSKNALIFIQLNESKLFRVIKNYNLILKEKKKFENHFSYTFNSFFIVIIFFSYMYLFIVVFYNEVNYGLTIFFATLYLTLMFGLILPFIIFEYKLSQQVIFLTSCNFFDFNYSNYF